jgi:transposase
MWTQENRARYDRSKLRYPSDLTDEEWALIRPLIPPAKPGGNKRTVDERAVLNGVLYILSTGCQWAALPKDLPPRSTVNDYLRRWDEDRTLDRIHHALYVLCREQAGREANPTAAIIDSQSVKGAEKGDAALIRRALTRARRSKARRSCGSSWFAMRSRQSMGAELRHRWPNSGRSPTRHRWADGYARSERSRGRLLFHGSPATSSPRISLPRGHRTNWSRLSTRFATSLSMSNS